MKTWLEDVALNALATMLIVAVVVVLGDLVCSGHVDVGTGFVVSKSYSPSSVDTGVVVGGKGGFRPVVTGHSEKYVLIVRYGDSVLSVETSAGTWADASEGSTVSVTRRQGWLFSYGYGAR